MKLLLSKKLCSVGHQDLKIIMVWSSLFLHKFLKHPRLAWNSIFGSKLQETCVLFIIRIHPKGLDPKAVSRKKKNILH